MPTLRTAALFTCTFVTLSLGNIGAAAQQSAADYLPAGMTVYFELKDGTQQLGDLLHFLDEQHFRDSLIYQQLKNNPDFNQALAGLQGLSAMADISVQEAVGSLLGDDLIIAASPGGNDDMRIIAATVTDSVNTRDSFLDSLENVAGLTINGEPVQGRFRRIRDVTVFATDDDIYHCRINNALLVSNDRELMKKALSVYFRKTDPLSTSPRYIDTLKTVPDDASAFMFLDTEQLRKLLQGQAAEFNDALPGYLFGAWEYSLRHSNSITTWITPGGNNLKLELAVNTNADFPREYDGFNPSYKNVASFNGDDLPGFTGNMILSRDWADLFSERESLLTARGADQVIEFSNNLTTLLGMLDFTDDVLPRVSGPLQLLIARQDFNGSEYTPSPVLPGFALVAPLTRDEFSPVFAERLYAGANMGLSLLSLDAIQNKRPALMVHPEIYKGHTIITSAFVSPVMMGRNGAEENTEYGKPAGIYYNYSPAVAVLNDRLIITTSGEMMRQLLNLYDEEQDVNSGFVSEKTPDTAVDSIELRFRPICDLLRDNRELIVADNMITKDLSRKKAEENVDLLLDIFSRLDSLNIYSRTGTENQRATAVINLR